MTGMTISLNDLKRKAQKGNTSDVDYLMSILDTTASFVDCKMVDFALGLVSTGEGRDRIRQFLFDGSQIQRNYASLYFKRLGLDEILDEAVRRGCIDTQQAYSK